MKLYRYRNIKSALAEIESGTLYFASQEELNDPIEGYVKLYFQGDQPAWEGLLRNYICSLFISIQRFLVSSPTVDYENRSIETILKDFSSTTVVIDINRFDDVPMGNILKSLTITFLNDASVKTLVKIYGNRDEKCYSKELQLILRSVHYTAFNICLRHCKSNGLLLDIPEIPSTPAFPFASIESMSNNEWIKFANEAENSVTDMMEWLDFVTRHYKENMTDNKQVTSSHRQHMTWATIMVNFPKIYVAQLQDVIYPRGYVVCFSATPTNSAMWGNYAQNHQGVCFIYETKKFKNQSVMPFDSRNFNIRKITYSSNVTERNFFDTLGRLTYPQIKCWLTGRDDSTSKSLDAFSEKNLDSWREKYWSNYVEKFHRKNSAWLHEAEYRILLHDQLYQYNKKENRYLKYDPASLKGIIFGINTSIDDKFKLIQAIKIVDDRFKDVKFFQSEYKEDTQEIDIREKIYPDKKFKDHLMEDEL